MKANYESELLQVIHEDMKGLHHLGIISDVEMKEFDRDCLVQTPKISRKVEQPIARENVTPAIV